MNNAADFLSSLKIPAKEEIILAKKLQNHPKNQIVLKFANRTSAVFSRLRRTLTDSRYPNRHPDEELYQSLDNLAAKPQNRVVLIIGRDKKILTLFGKNQIRFRTWIWIKLPARTAMIEPHDASGKKISDLPSNLC